MGVQQEAQKHGKQWIARPALIAVIQLKNVGFKIVFLVLAEKEINKRNDVTLLKR